MSLAGAARASTLLSRSLCLTEYEIIIRHENPIVIRRSPERHERRDYNVYNIYSYAILLIATLLSLETRRRNSRNTSLLVITQRTDQV